MPYSSIHLVGASEHIHPGVLRRLAQFLFDAEEDLLCADVQREILKDPIRFALGLFQLSLGDQLACRLQEDLCL